MNNATDRLFLKAPHKATAFSGILLQHGKQRSCAERREGGLSSGIHLLQWMEMFC